MLGVTAVVGQNLAQQKTAAAGLGTAIVSKVPAIGQSIAQSSIGQINTVLDQGIAAYGGAAATAGGAATGAGGAAAPAAPKASAAARARSAILPPAALV